MNPNGLRYSLIYAKAAAGQPWFAWFYFTGVIGALGVAA